MSQELTGRLQRMIRQRQIRDEARKVKENTKGYQNKMGTQEH